MAAYYNEIDPFAAQWLRNLIADGQIAPGDVDERSIVEVKADDLAGYSQCHFFAGIGGWSLALRLAGLPDDFPCWTGSCPCQPWSDANVWQGGGRGADDERHLWPPWFSLIQQHRPPVLFGEQVAGAIRKGWLDAVFDALEGEGYACGASVLPACAVGARHERKRLYWVAHADSQGRERHQPLECVSGSEASPLAVDGDPLAGARRALDGDLGDLLPCDGISIQLERRRVHGYGNAIVPQVAAAFIQAAVECLTPPRGAEGTE